MRKILCYLGFHKRVIFHSWAPHEISKFEVRRQTSQCIHCFKVYRRLLIYDATLVNIYKKEQWGYCKGWGMNEDNKDTDSLQFETEKLPREYANQQDHPA